MLKDFRNAEYQFALPFRPTVTEASSLLAEVPANIQGKAISYMVGRLSLAKLDRNSVELMAAIAVG